MNTIRKALLAATVIAAALVGTPSAALAQAPHAPIAAPAPAPAPASAPASAKLAPCGDSLPAGCLYAWADAGYNGARCGFFDSDSNWGDNCGNFRNRASALYNLSAGGNAANLYFHPGYTGAYACLHTGDYWHDLAAQGVVFSFKPGLDGYNTPANDEIAGFRWIGGNRCS